MTMRTMKRIHLMGIVFAAALIAGGVMALGTGSRGWKDSATKQNSLPIEVQAAVLDALVGAEGEYAAYATYAAILEEYGEVNPFANIVASEAKHIDALKQILERYGVPYPVENPYLGMIEAPQSLAEAAHAGVDAEIANIAFYETQLEAVADYLDIHDVFVNLYAASLSQHLPAFERAAARY
jgi:hypothetical protein